MSNSVIVNTAWCLKAPEVKALLEGRLIAAISHNFIIPGRSFALYPIKKLELLPIDSYYKANFLPIAQQTLAQMNTSKASILGWGRCEKCQTIDKSHNLEALSSLTIWKKEALEKILTEKDNFFLTYLRVYLTETEIAETKIELSVPSKTEYVTLPQCLSTSDALPVLSDRAFKVRLHQLENLDLPLYPELEALYSQIASISISNPQAKKLEQDIKIFLGWDTQINTATSSINQDWINSISALGNRSKTLDDGKSNYQAGTDFENIVRESLSFLGFTVDHFHKGGAGGVDVFCSKPYPLILECKAGKKIPNDTAIQLLNLGRLGLTENLFKEATKLIIGPGEPTSQLKKAAKVHNMAIINPETLEKLVKLQSIYPNSVDLFKLKEHLKAGQSDKEVEKYINEIYQEVSLRSQLVEVVKSYLENSGIEKASVDSIHGAFCTKFPYKLQPEEIHNILVELSSPLTGYLGKIKGENWKQDKFYFLRNFKGDFKGDFKA
jgi:hypothetical protein